jgi:Rod binding domain-containing protein
METYESMLDQEIANEMSKERGIGLADMLYYELRRKADIEETSQTQGLEDNAFSIRGD